MVSAFLSSIFVISTDSNIISSKSCLDFTYCLLHYFLMYVSILLSTNAFYNGTILLENHQICKSNNNYRSFTYSIVTICYSRSRFNFLNVLYVGLAIMSPLNCDSEITFLEGVISLCLRDFVKESILMLMFLASEKQTRNNL